MQGYGYGGTSDFARALTKGGDRLIIDAHVHLGRLNFSPYWTTNAQELVSVLDFADIDYCIASSAQVLIYDIKEGNREVLEATLSHKKILGYMVANPIFPDDSVEDLRKIKDEPQLVGCKMHPDYHGYDLDSPYVKKFMEKIVKYTSLMLFHTSCMPQTEFSIPRNICEIARLFPEVDFILAHAAGIGMNPLYPYHISYQLIEEIVGYGLDNIYIDTANGAIFAYSGVLEKIIQYIGEDRILFGTDFPIFSRAAVRSQVEIFRYLPLNKTTRTKILGGNARKLLGKKRGLCLTEG